MIIGAGMSGIACARTLANAGLSPLVLDKGRSPGGRMSTRRAGGFEFDHGAQFFTARSDTFRQVVDEGQQVGSVSIWHTPAAADGERHVGLPGMNGVVKHLAHGLEIRTQIEVSAITGAGSEWRVACTDGSEIPADIVVCTAPSPQAMNLVGGAHPFTSVLKDVEMAPCWALLLGFDQDFDPGWQSRRSDGDLAWIAHNGSKPGRSGAGWVVHASPEWSRTHLELTKEDAALRLHEMLHTELGELPDASYVAAHRWRCAMVSSPLGRPFLGEDGLYLGGDWALGPRVECAFDSGHAIAQAILER